MSSQLRWRYLTYRLMGCRATSSTVALCHGGCFLLHSYQKALVTSKNPQFQEEKISARKRGRSHVNLEKSSKNLISLFGEKPARGLPKPSPTPPCQESTEFTCGKSADAGREHEIQTRNWDAENGGGGEIIQNDATR